MRELPSEDLIHLIGCGWRRHDGRFKREDRHGPSTLQVQRAFILHAYKAARTAETNGADDSGQLDAFVDHLLEELDNFNVD